MGDIIFLAHRMPFPPDRGDKIRSHHLLKFLAERGNVHVGCFADTDADMEAEDDLARASKSHCLVRRTKPLVLAGAEAVISQLPVSLAAFHSRALERWVRDTVDTHEIEAIFVFSGQMGQYVPDRFSGRVIVDLCDVDSAKFEAYAEAGQRKWINAREGRLMSRVEAALVRRADTTLLISDNEADLLRSRVGKARDLDIRALGNGIDARFFDPDTVGLQPDLEEGEDPQLVFTGQMDYAPNVAAVEWVIAEVMPRLRQRYSRARFHIVGRAPGEALRSRHGESGVRVWGEVDDVRPFLKSADLVVAPLLIARGVQNKVLEAMAMAKPVLLTKEAATGIDAVDGEHFIVSRAEGPAFVSQIDRLFTDRQCAHRLGEAARKFVVEKMGWEAVHGRLAKIVRGTREDGNGA